MQKEIYYAGIGSRSTPEEVLNIMEKIGMICAKKGYILRSGAAKGADQAFEKGCDKLGGKKEIYLPWKGFENSSSDLYYENLPPKAEEIAFEFHPNLYKCSYGIIKMMARNSCQVLGKDCNTKSNFVVCYCECDANGNLIGGTSQALRIAMNRKIPIFNLKNREDLDKFKDHIKFLEGK